jgi:hypothetical protein
MLDAHAHAHAHAHADAIVTVQARLRLATATRRIGLQADCYTHCWSGCTTRPQAI